MITWKNLDTVSAYQELLKVAPVNLTEAMAGEGGAERVKKYSVPMAAGLAFNYAAKQVDDKALETFAKLAEEMQLVEKFEALYNGEVINTGEKRMVLHHLTRGQLGEAVVADGVDKRGFYVEQQKKIAELANKVHSGEITNAAGEKFTTVVQIGIGGSDLGPRAMYLALENWARVNGTFKMEARFISNVDPDDAAAVLNTIDVERSLFVLVSKSGTTLETLTNESFVKDALKNLQAYDRRHQRDLSFGEERRLSGRILHGRLYRRPVLLHLRRGRRSPVPGLWPGSLRPVPGGSGGGRQACLQ